MFLRSPTRIGLGTMALHRHQRRYTQSVSVRLTFRSTAMFATQIFPSSGRTALLQPPHRAAIKTAWRSMVSIGAPRAARVLIAAVAFAVLGSGAQWAHAQAAEGQPQLDLPRTTLRAGLFNIDAQVARTPATRATGLMWRRGMPQHEGMLFVFDQPAVQCFWMKNTPSPLTAAFVADDGVIVNLADMQPQTEDSHCSARPVRFVLEMNQGWFEKRGIRPGFRLSGDPFQGR